MDIKLRKIYLKHVEQYIVEGTEFYNENNREAALHLINHANIYIKEINDELMTKKVKYELTRLKGLCVKIDNANEARALFIEALEIAGKISEDLKIETKKLIDDLDNATKEFEADENSLNESVATSSNASTSTASTMNFLSPSQQKNEGQFKCIPCYKSYTMKQHLTRHLTTSKAHGHKNSKNIPCDGKKCKEKFTNKSNMKNHYNLIHLNERKFECNLCILKFKTKRNLDEHISAVHKKEKKFVCETCKKAFNRLHQVKQHQQSLHSRDQERYKCLECRVGFVLKYNLKAHLRAVHKEEKRFMCESCEYGFYYSKCHNKHTQLRICHHCNYKSNCTVDFVNHRATHTFTCDECQKIFTSYSQAHQHAKASHFKKFICSAKGCKSSFASKKSRACHMINVHHSVRCFDCSEMFENKILREKHFEENHVRTECYFCEGEEKFKFDDPEKLSKHLASDHKEIYHCVSCSTNYNDFNDLQSHSCSEKFDAKMLLLINALRKPIDLVSIDDEGIHSIFTDNDGLITQTIPGYPLQSSMSISVARNFERIGRKFKFIPIHMNQNQQVIQNGSTAILIWCPELNSLSTCTEYLAWSRNDADVILTKPHFNRKNVHFKKDEYDLFFKMRVCSLCRPYDLGHARAAGNCWSQIDFEASFSNLNYWAMHEKLNRNSWNLLEAHIRREAKNYECCWITTGPIFTQKGKVHANYVSGVIIPTAFFKIIFYQKFDKKLICKCYLMHNNVAVQTINDSEVSLLLIEDLTRKFFISPEVFERLGKTCIDMHSNKLRRTDPLLQ